MQSFFTNGTCDPFHAVSKPCTLGTMVNYAVNVSKPEHVTETIHFVKKHNIRLVIRNTGHDYYGGSTGAGAVAIWTHNLKDMKMLPNYKSAAYSGSALKMGAGVQGFDANKFAQDNKVDVVGGECESVGIAGGYTQGGGHSALSSRYGLGADQALEWEVIDGQGRFLVARPDNENADLYWALSDGGGSTYGVVWSLTTKAHPAVPVSAFNLTLSTTDNKNMSTETFDHFVELYNQFVPSLTDAGIMSLLFLFNTSFTLYPVTAPNIPVAELVQMMKPFTDALDKEGVNYTSHAQQFDTYQDSYRNTMPDFKATVDQFAGYLIPRSVVEDKKQPGSNKALTKAFRHILNDGGSLGLVALNVSRETSGPDSPNAVLPAWRETIYHALLQKPWDTNPAALPQMLRDQRTMTNEYVGPLQKLAPESGAYLNEADFRQKDFQRVFYGANYDKLKKIKGVYDPYGLFWAPTRVGSEAWTQLHDGRLCRT